MVLRTSLVAALLVATPGTASAFCRSTSCVGECERDVDGCKTLGAPLYWPTSCVGFALNAQASEFIDFATFRAVATRSVAAWSSLECPQGEATIAFVEQGPASCHVAEYDPAGPNANILLFQDTKWNYKGVDNTLAKTTVTYDSVSGEILDADIELNHAYNELTVGDDRVVYDLESILTHELGHFIGLDHSFDFDATMNASYDPGTVELRTLEQDDVAGACTVYPPSRKVACNPTPRGGFGDRCKEDPEDESCSLARTRTATSPALGVLALATAAFLGRRRSGLRRPRG